MPSFDIVSEVNFQEVRNAVDQANREVSTRFDFKGTDSSITIEGTELLAVSSTPDRLRALVQVLEEKMVRRQVSLKALHYGQIEEAAKGRARQRVTVQSGIDSEHARVINKAIKDLKMKTITSQVQGNQIRVSGKKRDDLQAVIASLKAEDFGIPLQFVNFRE
ncbi:MAG: YajQ family cyclic di-GMP-binding protein [Actinobacteria bacterium]|jgi:uncharacterized protein YajQ (UPF0234 family)|nr:YajQ family cyclic di-GMP-binding protein [Actinomycetota bacterium]MCL6095566.1 YajQ family cyclic di-GMP-binding protein [Actinomycetota bacterium]